MSISFGQKTMTAGGEDFRYRISITLIAEQRPKYWDFHCVKCKSKIAELSGTVLTISDAADVTVIPDYVPTPLVVKCGGPYCKMYYEFLTLSGRD